MVIRYRTLVLLLLVNLLPFRWCFYLEPFHAQEMLSRSKSLEDGLIALCGEKSLLECELNKMHSGSGRLA